MNITIDELIEAVRASLVYPYGEDLKLDAWTFLEELYRIKASKEAAENP